MRKVTSLLICLCLIIGSIAAGIGVNAAEGLTDSQKDALSLLSDLDIMRGVDEAAANNPVTRANFAGIITSAITKNDAASTGKRIYTDVSPDNANAAQIEYLFNRGLMIGYGNAEFRPDDNIKTEEVLVVAVKALGYIQLEEKIGKVSAEREISRVKSYLLSGTAEPAREEIKAADLAVVIKNILECDIFLNATGFKNGEIVIEKGSDNELYMEGALGIHKYTGVTEAVGEGSLSGSDDVPDEVCLIGGEQFCYGSPDMEKYLGMSVEVYYEGSADSGAYIKHIKPSADNRILEVNDRDIADTSTKEKLAYYSKSSMKYANIAKDAIFIYNGRRLNVVSDYDVVPQEGSVKLISNDGDAEYDVVVIKSYETYIVNSINTLDISVAFKYDRGSLELGEQSGIKAKYYMDGTASEFSQIMPGSVLSVALSKNLTGKLFAEIHISNTRITGTATAMIPEDGKSVVTLSDGSSYELCGEYERRIQDGAPNTYAPILGKEGTYYIDAFNHIAAYTLGTGGKNYAYVVKYAQGFDESDISLMLFTKEGEMKIYKVSEKYRINGESGKGKDLRKILESSGENGTINQVIIFEENESGEIKEIKTAIDKTAEPQYSAKEDEFVLNAHPKNDAGADVGVRFYKNLAENRPYFFESGVTIQFMIPTDLSNTKAFGISTKLSSTDIAMPAPVYIYDAKKGGGIGAVRSNTSSEGKFSDTYIIQTVAEAIDEEGMIGKSLEFYGGKTVFAGDDITYSQPKKSDSKGQNKWSSIVDYSKLTIDDLRRGDAIQYTTENGKIAMLRVIARGQDPGAPRCDGDNIALNGNIIGKVISVAENGKVAVINYTDRFGTNTYQSLHINSSIYMYEKDIDLITNATAGDIRTGDTVLINSFWWSPKIVVIYR